MARHAKNPTYPGLLWRLWPFRSRRRRTPPLDRVGPATAYPERAGAYRAVGVARVVYPPERPLLTLAGECRAGLWA
ncbi:hypothetical protein [Micromonospora sagamiensis]|uniref:Uncharacterized protein n=1 Tax=Micromonospora sagamiensis TaxID=47875 RepID=A0A562WQ99_9ACTN|nr:hypothetical protein [Micromonospora sagamiensis]TWJ32362.1 hypothetical protein JD81_05937 [Micromonospora sagamiensis]BCL14572.1 hypothetical protein GCM10017556_23110 [Micromonospora sagamiensis]